MVVKNILKTFTVVALATTVFASCRKAGGNYPGDQYTWDMINSRAYETYTLMPELTDSMSAIMPVEGTVPYVGNPIAGTKSDSLKMMMNLPYTYPNTTEGYEKAGLELKSPLNQNDAKVLADGKHFFDIYCAVCHGKGGDGKGFIVTEGKYKAVPPSYFDAGYIDMPDGKIFHSITYGKNAMQPYSYALTKEERWKVVAYINSLQDAHTTAAGAATPAATASTIK